MLSRSPCSHSFVCLLDSCQQFSACSSADLDLDCMSCSANYFKITSTKAEEEQQFQGALPVKMKVTNWRPGFLCKKNLLSLIPKKDAQLLRCSSVCVYVSKWHRVKALKEGYEGFKFSVKFFSWWVLSYVNQLQTIKMRLIFEQPRSEQQFGNIKDT